VNDVDPVLRRTRRSGVGGRPVQQDLLIGQPGGGEERRSEPLEVDGTMAGLLFQLPAGAVLRRLAVDVTQARRHLEELGADRLAELADEQHVAGGRDRHDRDGTGRGRAGAAHELVLTAGPFLHQHVEVSAVKGRAGRSRLRRGRHRVSR
jgi:hypothetical protein